MGKKIYVGNLSYSINNESLADKFATCGNVDSARVITDRDTGRSKGFGFVEMSSESEVMTAIQELDGVELDGRALKVNEARPQVKRY